MSVMVFKRGVIRGLSKTLLKQKSHTILGDDVVVDFQAAMAMAI